MFRRWLLILAVVAVAVFTVAIPPSAVSATPTVPAVSGQSGRCYTGGQYYTTPGVYREPVPAGGDLNFPIQFAYHCGTTGVPAAIIEICEDWSRNRTNGDYARNCPGTDQVLSGGPWQYGYSDCVVVTGSLFWADDWYRTDIEFSVGGIVVWETGAPEFIPSYECFQPDVRSGGGALGGDVQGAAGARGVNG